MLIHTRIPFPPNLSLNFTEEGWNRAPFSPGEDLMKIHLSDTFRFVTEYNSPSFLWCPQLMILAPFGSSLLDVVQKTYQAGPLRKNEKGRRDIARSVGRQYSSIQHVIYNLKSTRVYTSKPLLSRPSKLTIRGNEESATKLGLRSSFLFQHDNDPKHTAEIVNIWVLYNVSNELHMAPQSSDLNPAEHL
ncbi:hypothetical protein TNCV_4177701 [Trichonephila clavipes]|nr:hypothetical protein TNCV_4177701 [Trichonephila clavipes]